MDVGRVDVGEDWLVVLLGLVVVEEEEYVVVWLELVAEEDDCDVV